MTDNNASPVFGVPISITIDDQDTPVAPIDVTSPEVMQALRERVGSANSVVIHQWDRVARLPFEPRQAFLELAAISGPVTTVRVGETSYPDAFAASLALPVDVDDLTDVARYQDFAIAVATACHPGAASEAARRIRDRLRELGVQADDVRSLARRIRDGAVLPKNPIILKPQDAADIFLAAKQEVRLVRGETDIKTPPCWYYNGDIYLWTGMYWMRESHLTETVTRVLQTQTQHPLSGQFVQSAIINIRAKVLLDRGGISLPMFVEEDPPVCRPYQVLVFENGFIEIEDMQRSGTLPSLHPHDARVFACSALTYPYDPTALCPLWQDTIAEILRPQGADDHRIAVLQEFLGYVLLVGDCRFEKFLVLVGGGANGKSTVLKVITAAFGSINVSHVGLESFGSDPHLLEMANKWVNTASEMHRIERVEEGLLKTLVSGESRVVNRKFLPATTFFPTAKLIFSTNALPQFADTSMGIWRRMIVIHFLEVFAGDRCDLYRIDRLIAERAGILNWILAGAMRLLRQGGFTRCAVCEAALHEYQLDSDPFRQFLDECCDLQPDRAVLVADLYRAYCIFCDRNNRGAKGNAVIGRQVKGLPGVVRHRESSGRREYYYEGIGLRSPLSLGLYLRPPQREGAGHPRGVMVGRPTTS
ncbi:MAG: hypothetical protein FJ295_21380 [Planctomycetes bacterium]|nr:hypothetical protein [Planctomycetota bacterium]